MDTLTPPDPQPAPLPATIEQPLPPAGPACAACGTPAVVQWQRRPTDDELDAIHRLENDRRAHARKLADPQQPEPVYPPLPTGTDTSVAVYACAQHALTLTAAASIHASSCTAPNKADLPGCDCTPETLPAAPLEEEQRFALPTHWQPAGQ